MVGLDREGEYMSTFEHRLQTVEYGLSQLRTETIKAYQDVAKVVFLTTFHDYKKLDVFAVTLPSSQRP